MPEISRFLGIVIAMFYRDHHPPHFHAYYGGHEVTVEIESGRVIGFFPRRALGHVMEWRTLHQVELEENWLRLRRGDSPLPIVPLE